MKKLYPVVALCALALLLSGQSKEDAKNGDKSAPAESADKNRITLDVSRVNMLYTVSDKKGRFVTDLGKDDFEVFENKKPQTIIEFAAETDLPLRLAILIDTSNSIRDRFHFQQEAATAFIDGTVRPEHDKAMIVSFDTAAELVADLTDNVDQLEKAVARPAPRRRHLALRRHFLRLPRQADGGPAALQIPPRHGDPERRRRQPEPLHARSGARDGAKSRRHGLHHFHQHHAHRNRRRQGAALLRFGNRRAGLLPVQGFRFNQSFENIANELRHQYNIFYRPEPLKADGLYHTVEIRVKGHKDLIVRARKGYYAPKL